MELFRIKEIALEIEERVLLLGIFKKESDESLDNIVQKLENAGVFTYKDGKKLLKSLRSRGYIEDQSLTLAGIEKGKDIEREFKLQ